VTIGTAAILDRVGTGNAVFRLAHGWTCRRELGVVGGWANVDGAAAAGIAGIRFLVEADPLSLAELIETLIFDAGAVEEEVAVGTAAVAGNETESFVADRLDSSGRHEMLLAVGGATRATGLRCSQHEMP
jgi:hypothetical protein